MAWNRRGGGPPAAAAAASWAVVMPPPVDPFQRSSLYVGDLDDGVTEMDLRTVFGAVGPVLSVRLCRCSFTGKSLCYGYVNFCSPLLASRAMALLNHSNLKGKPMRLMWSQRDTFARKNGIGNLFVKNLHPSIDSARLESTFSQFGTILSCKVVEENGISKCFAFVQFDSEESAAAARSALHDTVLEGKQLYVSKFVSRSERMAASGEESKFTNLYVKNLTENVTDDGLQNLFSAFGKVCNVVIMKDSNGKSKGFGFVNFESPEDAKKALSGLNGSLLDSKILFVGKAQKKAERARMLKQQYTDKLNSHREKFKGSNLIVKYLGMDIDDRRLRELFSAYGKIVSAKVMRDSRGLSKGFGFVCFSCPEEAENALNSVNGTKVNGNVLKVAIANDKRDNHRQLQNGVAQYQPLSSYLPSYNVVTPSFLPVYLDSSSAAQPLPFLHQPVLYDGFGANLGVHYPFPTHHYQQPFSSHIPAGQAQVAGPTNVKYWSCPQQLTKYASFNVVGRGLNHKCGGGQRFGFEKKGRMAGEGAVSTSEGPQGTRYISVAVPAGNSRKDIGNVLYPLVETLQPEHARRITERLLEMKNSDVLKLINSPNSLAIQVDKTKKGLDRAKNFATSDGAVTLPKSARRLNY